jgi:hypothetical protein
MQKKIEMRAHLRFERSSEMMPPRSPDPRVLFRSRVVSCRARCVSWKTGREGDPIRRLSLSAPRHQVKESASRDQTSNSDRRE